jgi:hypothetical protein
MSPPRPQARNGGELDHRTGRYGAECQSDREVCCACERRRSFPPTGVSGALHRERAALGHAEPGGGGRGRWQRLLGWLECAAVWFARYAPYAGDEYIHPEVSLPTEPRQMPKR